MKRELITVSGRVQGVGFRDHVVEVARRFGVAGTVANVRAGARVAIDVEGRPDQVDAFVDAVLADPPPAARIAGVERVAATPQGADGFHRGPTLAQS